MTANGSKWMLALIIILGLLAVGCSREDEDSGLAVSDEQALAQMISEDTDLESSNPWAGDEDAIAEGGSLDEAITPIRWVRLARRSIERTAVEIEGDTFATITHYRGLNGVLRIVTDTTEGQHTFLDKSMHNRIVRKAHAVRVGNGPRPRLNWRIVEVTPELLESVAPNPQTVAIQRVEVSRVIAGGTPETLADIDQPLDTWLARGELPMVGFDDQLIVRVTTDPAQSLYGVLHPRVFPGRAHPRLRMYDDGMLPDEVADDGIFTGTFAAHERPGVHLLGVDMLSEAALFDSEGLYDAEGWGIPYRVVAPN